MASLTLGALLATTTLPAAVPTTSSYETKELAGLSGEETLTLLADTIGLPPAVPNQQSPTPEPADPNEVLQKRVPSNNVHYIVSETTSLHRGPNGNTEVLTEVKAGELVTVKSKKYKFWWLVETNHFEGWINSVILLPAEMLEEVEAPASETASRSPEASNAEFTQKGLPAATLESEYEYKAPTPIYEEIVDQWYSVSQETSLRTGPSSKYKVLHRLSGSDKLTLIEKTNTYWWKMELDGETGYVKAALLESSGEKVEEVVLKSPVLTAKSPEPESPKVEKAPVTIPEGAYYFAPPEATIQEATPKTVALQATYDRFEITQRTSLRTTPNSQAEVLTRLGEGEAVTILEKTNRYWWKVSYGNMEGYAKAHLLKEQ